MENKEGYNIFHTFKLEEEEILILTCSVFLLLTVKLTESDWYLPSLKVTIFDWDSWECSCIPRVFRGENHPQIEKHWEVKRLWHNPGFTFLKLEIKDPAWRDSTENFHAPIQCYLFFPPF